MPASPSFGPVWLALVGVFFLSILLRLPNAQIIPSYTDEVRLVKYAARLSWGEAIPLSLTGYNGPLMVYLLALALKVWPTPETPRLVAVLLGATLPTLTAMICLRRGQILPALLAAGLLSSSFSFVVIYGHLPWAVSLGLFFLLLVWYWSHGPLGGQWPHAAGFCYGLSLQCYPLLVAFAPWILVRHFAALGASARRRAAYLALVILALSPVALHHLLEWAREGLPSLGSSAPELIADARTVSYGDGLLNLLRSLVDAVSGAGHAEHFRIIQDPLAILLLALLLLALLGAVRRRDGFVVVNGLSFLLITPILVRQYGFPMGTRYSALCLPIVMLAIAALTPHGAESSRFGGKILRSGWILLMLALMLGSLQRIQAFYRAETDRGRTNVSINGLVDLAARSCDEIVLDNRIDAEFPAGGGYSRVVEARLNLHGIRPARADDARGLNEAIAAIADKRNACAVLSDGHLVQLQALTAAPRLEGFGRIPASEFGEGIHLLRIQAPIP